MVSRLQPLQATIMQITSSAHLRKGKATNLIVLCMQLLGLLTILALLIIFIYLYTYQLKNYQIRSGTV